MLFLACALSMRAQAPADARAGSADIPVLISALRDPKPETRAEARAALVKAGPEAVPALVAAIAGERSRRINSKILEDMGPQVTVPALMALLDDPELRGKAGSQLFLLIGPESGHLAPELLTCISQKPEVRHYCGQALVKSMSQKSSVQTALLASALKDGLSDVRLYAAAALGQIGSRAKQAVPALAEALKDSEPVVRLNAALALGKMGRGARPALPALRAAALEGPPELRRQIEEIVKGING
ncbi:MAG: HEAT repeat domain-containing protein [Elusimicrobiota bacterium]